MRVTSSMYYDNLYGQSNSKLSKKLFDVNKQIASGLQIQYASDDVSTFVETMRLDNELTVLGQVKKSTQSASKVADQTDTVMNEFTDTLDRMRVLFINASNASSSKSSRDAIAEELKGLNDHLKNLANTSINGQFLFSGSAVDTRPIAADGTYKGNDKTLKAFLGSNVQQQYNIPGSTLFLGEENGVNREITSNVRNNSLTAEFPDFTDTTVKGTQNSAITTSSTIRDLMGNKDNTVSGSTSHFYLRGVKHDGTAFNKDIQMSSTSTVAELLKNIGDVYGNTLNADVVNVNLNQYGQIVVEDKIKGSSKLDFNLTAAIDYDQTDGNDAADITSPIYANSGEIDNLKYGETNFKSILNGTSKAANSNLFVKSFTQSPYASSSTYDTVLKSEDFAMSRSVASGDTLSITVNNGDGITPATTLYSQPFTTDAATTYDALKTQIEGAGDFTVSIVGDTITLNTTAQGAARNVSIDTVLSNDNGSGVGVVTLNPQPTPINSVLADNIYSISYDRTEFTKTGSQLSSDVTQVVKGTNAFATPSTKLSEVADLSQGNADTLDGTKFRLVGKDISGADYDVTINLNNTVSPNNGSTFTDNTVSPAKSYDIFDMSDPRVAVNADDMTYQQLMDVVSMVTTKTYPASDNTSGNKTQEATDYDKAIGDATFIGNTKLSYDGKLTFSQLNTTDTKATISLYDAKSGKIGADSSVMSFNSNNALTIRDPKTDFFKSIDQMIQSVVEYKEYPDASTGDKRGVGMENSIQMMDDLFEHVNRSHSVVGAQSNTLTRSLERTELLEISTMTLRSSTVDTDLAEASLNLTQLTLNYQAMLSTVGKVSQLSLVNYL